jgi:uncharacterized membrane protein affecting hemolysin expression
MVIATYLRTTANNAHWYGASLSEIQADAKLLQYFTEKQARDAAKGYTTVIFDEAEDQLRWCTQYETADTLHLTAGISQKTGNLFLNTAAVLTLEQRQALLQSKKAAEPTTGRKPLVDASKDAKL